MNDKIPQTQNGDDDPKVQAYRLRLVEQDVRDIKGMVKELHAQHLENKGAWKTIIVLSTVVSFIVTTVIALFKSP